MKNLKKTFFLIFLPALVSIQHAQAAILPSSDPASWSIGEIEQIINNVMTYVAEIGGALAVLLIIYASFNYLTAYGNEEKVSAAKKMILWTIIGIVVIMLAKILIATIVGFVK